jgi:hypothetical protein
VFEDWLRAGIVGELEDLERALLAGDRAAALRYWDRVRNSYNPAAVTWMLASRQIDPRWGRGSAARGSSAAVSRLLRECYRLERGIKAGEIPSNLQGTACETMIFHLAGTKGATAPSGEGERRR